MLLVIYIGSWISEVRVIFCLLIGNVPETGEIRRLFSKQTVAIRYLSSAQAWLIILYVLAFIFGDLFLMLQDN